MLKRPLDLALALIGLLLLLPVLAGLALWIKVDSPGPVFYRGPRVGRGGKAFRIFKFRSMRMDADQGPSSSGVDDPRITRVGRFLRAHKLDELPQLLNVVRGEMSLVGPRPQVQWSVERYTPGERALLSVRPGITDYASLRFRDEGEILRGSVDPDREYLERIAPEKIRLGLHYAQYHTVEVDLKILVATMGSLVGVDPEWCLPRPEDT